MNSYHLRIVTPEGVGFDGDVNEFYIRTIDGQVGILAGHIDYIASTEMCIGKITDASGKKFKAVCGGGFLRVSGDTTTLVTDFFEKDSYIDEDEAKASLSSAKEKLDSIKGERETVILKNAVKRASFRAEIASKK